MTPKELVAEIMQEMELYASMQDGDDIQPFYLRVSAPMKTDGADDFSCLVHAPALFAEDKRIFGINEEQAIELALEFVRSLLKGKRLLDKAGRPIAL